MIVNRTLLLSGLWLVAVLVIWYAVGWGYDRLTTHRMKQWEAGVTRDANGVREGCQAFTLGEGRTTLIMVHGFADSPALYRDMAQDLAKTGLRCRAIRLPGFAEPFPAYASTDRNQWRDYLWSIVLEERERNDQVWVAAHSLGGAVTLDLLAEHPHAVDGLVLFNPLLNVSSARSPVFSAERWFRISEVLLPQATVVESVFPIDVQGDLPTSYPGRDIYIPRSIHRELWSIIRANREHEHLLKIPVQLFLSREDLVADPNAAARMVATSAAGVFEQHWVETSGHVIPLDRNRAEVSASVAEFIRSNSGSAR